MMGIHVLAYWDYRWGQGFSSFTLLHFLFKICNFRTTFLAFNHGKKNSISHFYIPVQSLLKLTTDKRKYYQHINKSIITT